MVKLMNYSLITVLLIKTSLLV